ncbi:hypothetical protein BCR39DRAFT_572404 [Naematelia encephala]|uniref:RRM domain-containing protein n=1 Tax=Naematelia encephala TaxID=71784 RepID=A0A1Y2BIF3_9TREE|nr:hypothetical protein BCR39DRAFT_572404 [Naematelia encephala]
MGSAQTMGDERPGGDDDNWARLIFHFPSTASFFLILHSFFTRSPLPSLSLFLCVEMQSIMRANPAHNNPRPAVPRGEIRLYGLVKQITTDSIVGFFSELVQVLDVQLHPQEEDFVWAQVIVGSEKDMERCLTMKGRFASCAMIEQTAHPISSTMSRHPPVCLTPESTPPLDRATITPLHLGHNYQLQQAHNQLPAPIYSTSLRQPSLQGPLKRNLYVVNLPVDMSDVDFEGTFTPFGMVEHAKLLSQLDAYGRRRGFILLSTHQEAVRAMNEMHGQWVESWTSIPLEPRHTPTSGDCPPTGPTGMFCDRRKSFGLGKDPSNFPSAGTIRSTFGHFGNVVRVTVLPGVATAIHSTGLSALIQFEHATSATLLLSAHGLKLGEREISTRPLIPRNSQPPLHLGQQILPMTNSLKEPFSNQAQKQNYPAFLRESAEPENELATFCFDPFGPATTSLKADSEPFVPRMIEQDMKMRGSSSPTHEGDSNDSGSHGQRSVNTASTRWEARQEEKGAVSIKARDFWGKCMVVLSELIRRVT